MREKKKEKRPFLKAPGQAPVKPKYFTQVYTYLYLPTRNRPVTHKFLPKNKKNQEIIK